MTYSAPLDPPQERAQTFLAVDILKVTRKGAICGHCGSAACTPPVLWQLVYFEDYTDGFLSCLLLNVCRMT